MLIKWIKKWIPSAEKLQQSSELARIRHLVSRPVFWSFNRRSCSRAVAIGLFVMFLPMPFQMLWAALLAIFWRANIPIAVSLTWLNNPFTFIPFNLFVFYSGQRIFSWASPQSIATKLPPILKEPSPTQLLDWLTILGKPYLIGLIFLILVSSLVGYSLTSCLWRFFVARQWHNRLRRIKKSP